MPTSVSSPGDVPANTSQDPESARFGCDGEALFWRDVLPLPPRRTFPSTPPNTMSLPGIRSTLITTSPPSLVYFSELFTTLIRACLVRLTRECQPLVMCMSKQSGQR